jgi:murein DD-endopeptidase MepM/ murein hydrolase activator NlpD
LVLTSAGLVVLAGCGGPTPSRQSATGVSASATPAGTPSAAASPTPSAAPAPTVPTAYKRVFPVDGKASYGRTHHDYPATDIFANCGLPVRAPIDGAILEVSRVDRFDSRNPRGADKGGKSFSILGDDGVRYYGSHLGTVLDGIEAGKRVTAGQQVGTVGRTGNASNTCHLHFGISPGCARTGDWWIRRGIVYPWRYLDAWRAGNSLSPATETAAWQKTHGCPSTPPPGER